MTVVGKVLVFVNLVFSVIVGFLVIMVHIVNTHGADREKKLVNQVTVANANLIAYQNELDASQSKAKAQAADLTVQLKKTQDDLDAQLRLNKDLQAAQRKSEKANTRHDAVAKGSQAEVGLRQEDVDQMRTTLKKEIGLNNQLVKDNADLRDKAVSAQLVAKSLQDQNNRIEAQLREMAQTLVRVRANGGAGATTTAKGGKNPPPDDVQGLIETADTTGLVTITIGSDAGLHKGNTLEVFRLGRTATQSKYLGTIRIVEVTPTKAVGQPVGRMTTSPQRGDHVASRILGS